MKRIILWVLGALILLLVGAWFGIPWWFSRSVADYEGEITLKGISHPVEITFDQKGIPQVWAETDEDMYFALGWLHASERLFQMELTRRFVKGTLAEVFGRMAFVVDVQQRRLGFYRKALAELPQLSPKTRTLIEKYCAGINAWMKHTPVLPPEFTLVNIEAEPWKVEDCLGILFYQTWYSHSLMARDRVYDQLLTQLEDIALQPALRRFKKWSPPTVHDSFIREIFGGFPFPFRMSFASNSWVVAPERSVSGKALHASDPHLAVNQAPGFWYIAGLHSAEGVNIIGVTAPGLPFVAMGHNDSIAYAFTVSSVDVIDYFRYQRHPEDTLKVLTSNGYQLLKMRYEDIKIQGKSKPLQIAVYEAPAGPVIEMDSASVLAVHWAGYDFNVSSMLENAVALHRISNFQDFRKTVTGLGALDANWVYSDVQGNIGYQLGTPIPKRQAEFDPFLEIPGEYDDLAWHEYYPLEQTPHVLNPPEGWIASCNNQIVSDQWPYEVPGFYDPYRIVRAKTLLQEKKQYSVKDMERMQLDYISAHALRWKNLLAIAAEKTHHTELVEQIRQWDGNMAGNSRMATLFSYWWEILAQTIFEDELQGNWPMGKYILEEVISEPITSVIDDKTTSETVETLEDMAAKALQMVVLNFEIKPYKEVSILQIEHPLSKIKFLDMWFGLSRGPFPMPGGKGTLNANLREFNPQTGKFECFVAPSMRYVLDWADVDGFTINGNMGQSGNPFSPHYDDFLEVMLTGQRWNVPFSKGKVYEKKETLLVLKPESR